VPSTAPAIGATQNSHNCSIAQPPAKTATPVFRAGFTFIDSYDSALFAWFRQIENFIFNNICMLYIVNLNIHNSMLEF